MGLFKALDTIVHGGVEQPESYEKKKNYIFSEILGELIH
jgi:calcium/calmodulin-dependent protein kinase I